MALFKHLSPLFPKLHSGYWLVDDFLNGKAKQSPTLPHGIYLAYAESARNGNHQKR
jgi:hypothetical protein